MPLPLAPVAVIALRCGAVALTAWAAKRALAGKVTPGRRDQRLEDALDELPEGLSAHHAPLETSRHAATRFERRIRIGEQEWHVDAALLARLRLKKV